MLVGMFADSHCSDREVSCRTRRPSLSYGKIAAALDAFTAAGAQAVIMLGDLMDSCVDPADNVRELERTGALICSAGLPVYCLRGNHDCDILSAADFYAVSGFAAPPFSVAKDGRALIFLDGCFTADGMPYRHGEVDWTDSLLSAAQVGQLGRVLGDSNVTGATVFIHQRLDGCTDARYNVRNSDEVRAVLEASGKVGTVFQGHYHRGDRKEINGIRYITLPAMCEGEGNSFIVTEV